MRRFMGRWSACIGIAWTSGAFFWNVFWGMVMGGWLFWGCAAVMLVLLVAQVRMERETRRRRMARAVDHSDEPIPPVNVRLEQPDGAAIPVELVYGGRDPATGMHMWFAVTPVRSLGMLKADYLPKDTAIAIQRSAG